MPSAVILGSGTSTGVPMVGREYSTEFLADPKNYRTRSSLLLEGPEGNVLIDAGPDIRHQLLREDVKSIEGVIITHTHADHIMGMDDLRAFSMTARSPVEVYTAPNYQEDIRRIFNYAFGEFPKGVWVPRFSLNDLPSHLSLGGLNITTFWVDHGPLKAAGIRVNNFAYLTDVSEIPPAAKEHLTGLDTLVLDAVRLRPHPNHFHLSKALEQAAEIGAKQTWLTHLSDDFSHDRDEPDLPNRVKFAFDGLRIQV
jgi:phosphoribosyl 1,2-cyclic phosphate phosphodiesterase